MRTTPARDGTGAGGGSGGGDSYRRVESGSSTTVSSPRSGTSSTTTPVAGSPRRRLVGSRSVKLSIRSPSRKVPLALPGSSTSQPPFSGRSSRWRRDTRESWQRTRASGPRPMTTTSREDSTSTSSPSARMRSPLIPSLSVAGVREDPVGGWSVPPPLYGAPGRPAGALRERRRGLPPPERS